MDFRTIEAPVKGYDGIISHGYPILLIGSCFSDNIGALLSNDLFEVMVNPFGPLYNPLSIERALGILSEQDYDPTTSILEENGIIHSFDFHSRFSGYDHRTFISKAMDTVKEGHSILSKASVIIITLGTTRVFFRKQNGVVVANCHKQPASCFDISVLDPGDTTDSLSRIMDRIRCVNPNAHVIFTVSPLRYLGEGSRANTLYKSTLHIAVDRICREYPDVIYFPSFEIMMDDLRDYRFYAADMKHPSQQAVEYIYDIFSRSYFNPKTMALAQECRKLTRRLSHRSLIKGREVSSGVDDIAGRLIGNHPELLNAYSRYIQQ